MAKAPVGLIIINTGDGKGKTTAALGTALRAAGYHFKTCIVQFIKGDWHYGELDSVQRLAPEVELHKMGKGFVRIMGDKKPIEEHIEAARGALAFARDKMVSGRYHLVILDEVHNAVKEGLISVEDVLGFLDEKPATVHVILTGRDADPRLIERADMVTEMKMIKHPFQQGLLAQQGIEF